MEAQRFSGAEGKTEDVLAEKLQRLLEMKEFISGTELWEPTASFSAHEIETSNGSCGSSCGGGGGGSCGSCRVTELNS